MEKKKVASSYERHQELMECLKLNSWVKVDYRKKSKYGKCQVFNSNRIRTLMLNGYIKGAHIELPKEIEPNNIDYKVVHSHFKINVEDKWCSYPSYILKIKELEKPSDNPTPLKVLKEILTKKEIKDPNLIKKIEDVIDKTSTRKKLKETK